MNNEQDKKVIWKKWWFWLIIFIIIVFLLIFALGKLTEYEQRDFVREQGCASWQVNINEASREALKEIIHIDEVRVEELINLRPFHSVEDLIRVPGIGPVRIQEIIQEGIVCVE